MKISYEELEEKIKQQSRLIQDLAVRVTVRTDMITAMMRTIQDAQKISDKDRTRFIKTRFIMIAKKKTKIIEYIMGDDK